MKEDREIYTLDTSALLTYIEDENGSDYVENLLIKAEKGDVLIYIAFISLTEVFYLWLKGINYPIRLSRFKGLDKKYEKKFNR